MNRTNPVFVALLFVGALLLAPCRLEAGAFDDANHAFADGRFEQAVKGYEAVLHEKGYSAPVLYNLANAYFREGQIGLAILNYNRAQLLAPADPDIAANLNLARKQAGLFAEQNSWIKEASCFLSMNEWSWLGSMMLFAGCALIFAGRVYPSQRFSLALWAGIAAVALVVTGVAMVTQFDTVRHAVVTAKEAVARISPFESAQSTFVLSTGEEVNVEKAHGGFLLVENREHRTGWISRQQIERVIPSGKRM